ncbi:DUF4142 domain-containing protein [Chryseolinea lacunae]|uniref:DUF4142 domain-containing protein n=1 Tax=Chryseolinea lacunae TaxID=2801331 RepID=A0ABS1KZW0_9BACT|nr:DUF4142 domain-containing protein [Chryseolinea lacunae]MBL0744990.1 DUF4142 domain-containing protein [Chryseolinea lacunae]
MKNFLLFLNISILGGLAYLFSGSTTAVEQDQATALATTLRDESPLLASATLPVTLAELHEPAHVNMSDLIVDLDEKPVDEVAEKFLTTAIEARIMDLEQGRAAQQRSATDAVKDYGTLMLRDQNIMLNELRAIAASKHITLPEAPDAKQQEALATLQQQDGKAFDKKFIKMMIIDHKRDVRKFRKATHSNDVDVKAFAVKYLPVVEAHLDYIQKLK